MGDTDISLDEQIAEVERELKLREIVYPRWISADKPKLSPPKAKQQMDRMRAVLASLQELKRLKTQS